MYESTRYPANLIICNLCKFQSCIITRSFQFPLDDNTEYVWKGLVWGNECKDPLDSTSHPTHSIFGPKSTEAWYHLNLKVLLMWLWTSSLQIFQGNRIYLTIG